MTLISGLLLVTSPTEKSYLPSVRNMLRGFNVQVTDRDIPMLSNLVIICGRLGVTTVVTSQPELICKLAEFRGDNRKKKLHLKAGDYEGSMFHYEGLEILCIPPLATMYRKSYGQFLIKRYISKVTEPHIWPKQTAFSFTTVRTVEQCDEMVAELLKADILVIDVENDYKTNVAAHVPVSLHPKLVNGTAQLITEIGFTGMYWNEATQEYTTKTYTTKLWPDNFHAKYAACKQLVESNIPKCLQNGKSDIVKLIRIGMVTEHYLWDTLNLMHCMYSELPKSLDFLMAFGVRDMAFWKWMSESSDPYEQEVYNALDTWATANALISLIAEINKSCPWAIHNYMMEFPVVFPSLMMELQGIPADMKLVQQAYDERIALAEEFRLELEILTGTPGFNPNSPAQVKKLVHAFGYRDVESCDEKNLDKLRNKDPVLGRIISVILDIRGILKEASTYLAPDKYWNNRFYACFNPHGTDTGRLASTEHHFNVGGNEQNIPREKSHERLKLSVKDCFVLPEGWYFAECDYAQAESRDTAYITGDVGYIKSVDESPDFHSANASVFFGVPFHEIYDVEKGEVIDKALRNLAKPVNHGANYNMGPWMMLVQMGEKKVAEAKKLLGLPAHWGLMDVCEHLLKQFDKSYPVIRGDFQRWIKAKVSADRKLTNPLGWTRYCFGNPSQDKMALNAYVAQLPQSLNGSTLNKAIMNVFWNIVIPHGAYFKIFAQIHDSILMAYKHLEKDITSEGITLPATDKVPDALPMMVVEQMQFPVPVTDIKGIKRILNVPADCKYGERSWGGIKG